MNGKELFDLLAQGETELIEFKQRPSDSLYKSISAFANTGGGTLLLGVDDRVGNTTREMKSEKLRTLALRSQPWDSITNNCALEEINSESVQHFIQIKVYDDRIWFSNLGGLPEGITVEELKRPHTSFLRNPIVAKVFYLGGSPVKVSLVSISHLKPVVERVDSVDWLDKRAWVGILCEPTVL